jgi:hypothetical protein
VQDLRDSGYLAVAVIDLLAPPGPIHDPAALRDAAPGRRSAAVARAFPEMTVSPGIFVSVAPRDRLAGMGHAGAA